MKRQSKKAQVVANAAEYDQFLGRFVDSVQTGGGDFHALLRDWNQSCPSEWQSRFGEDATEIESLVELGVFCRGDAA